MKHYVFTVPHGTKVEIKYEERRNHVPRRLSVCAPIIEGAVYGTQMTGRRKAPFDRRTINGTRASVPVDRTERRDPDREMYQYKTSADPRIRALERRGGIPGRIIEIGSGRSVRDRRVATGPRRVDLVSCREYPLKAGRRWGLCDRRKP